MHKRAPFANPRVESLSFSMKGPLSPFSEHISDYSCRFVLCFTKYGGVHIKIQYQNQRCYQRFKIAGWPGAWNNKWCLMWETVDSHTSLNMLGVQNRLIKDKEMGTFGASFFKSLWESLVQILGSLVTNRPFKNHIDISRLVWEPTVSHIRHHLLFNAPGQPAILYLWEHLWFCYCILMWTPRY